MHLYIPIIFYYVPNYIPLLLMMLKDRFQTDPYHIWISWLYHSNYIYPWISHPFPMYIRVDDHGNHCITSIYIPINVSKRTLYHPQFYHEWVVQSIKMQVVYYCFTNIASHYQTPRSLIHHFSAKEPRRQPRHCSHRWNRPNVLPRRPDSEVNLEV